MDRLKTVYNKQSSPLNDNTIEVARFCRSLEAILRHGQKGQFSYYYENVCNNRFFSQKRLLSGERKKTIITIS